MSSPNVARRTAQPHDHRRDRDQRNHDRCPERPSPTTQPSRVAKQRLLVDPATDLRVIADLGLHLQVLCNRHTHSASLPSTMWESKINPSDPTPLYLQVAAEIRRAIADGEARSGDRLPLARDLATVLEVNPNTVLRAVRTLRDEGLLDFRRGRGITVTGTPQQGLLLRRVNELVDYARSNGYRREELITMINDAPWPQRAPAVAAEP